jgi:hypothetical protein
MSTFVFVDNIPATSSYQDIRDMFNKVGRIEEFVYTVTDKKIARITYESEEVAEKAVAELNGAVLHQLRLHVSMAATTVILPPEYYPSKKQHVEPISNVWKCDTAVVKLNNIRRISYFLEDDTVLFEFDDDEKTFHLNLEVYDTSAKKKAVMESALEHVAKYIEYENSLK